MKRALKRKWLRALRSGDYRQGTWTLVRFAEDGDLFCCLGVLADVNGETFRAHPDEPGLGVINGGPEDNCSNQYGERSGLLTWPQAKHLINMNDRGKSFAKIAQWIEKNIPEE